MGKRAPVLAISLTLAMGALVGYSREYGVNTNSRLIDLLATVSQFYSTLSVFLHPSQAHLTTR